MLDELCAYLRNWFDNAKYTGTFTIAGGQLQGMQSRLKKGQYYRIIGSVFNDGIYHYPDLCNLKDEVFEGGVWALSIPREVENLARDIEAWNEKYGGIDSPALSPFSSENFAGYSYSKEVDTQTGAGAGGWQKAFAPRLSRWKKI